MANTEYNFDDLKRYLERNFLNPYDAIKELEKIEQVLLDAEKLFVLSPELNKALQVLSQMIEHLNSSIPSNKQF